jgi:hypothetical protein
VAEGRGRLVGRRSESGGLRERRDLRTCLAVLDENLGGRDTFAYEEDARPKGWIAWCERHKDAMRTGILETRTWLKSAC